MTTERNVRSEARNRLMSLGIGLLFIGPVLPLQAAELSSVPSMDEIRSLPVSLTPLERELLADVGDGRLDRFDLIASGATEPVLLSRYKRSFRHLQQHALLSIPYLMQTEQMAAELFHYLHRYVLRQFETRPVTVINLWTDGRYNCIAASRLYVAFRNALGAQLTHSEDKQYQQLTLDLGLAYATFLRQRGDRAGESGIIAYLRGLKKNVRGAYPRRTLTEVIR